MLIQEELSERKMRILKTLIDDYIQTAQPVGSRTISKKHDLGLSSATIRNEMADLEEMGYITQPHTSAGRVPSDKGYRLYVDHLMQAHTLALDEIKQIRSAIQHRIIEINALIVRASDIISTITGYTSLALSPNLTKAVLKTIQIIPVDDKKALIVAVTDGGAVKNQYIRFENEIDPDILVKMSNFLQERMNGLLIEKIIFPPTEEVYRELKVEESATGCIFDGLSKCLQGIEKTELITKGETNILNHPEFSDLIKAKEVFDLLNDCEIIKTVMSEAVKENELNVMIGRENQYEPMHDCSLVTAAYNLGNTSVGALGVLGPTRMPYARVVSAMKYVKRLINREIIRIINDG